MTDIYSKTVTTVIVVALTVSACLSIVSTSTYAATWDVLQSQHFKKWETTLNRNNTTGEQFCAAETNGTGSTTMRINFYKSNNGSFLEFYNSNWDLLQGGVRFTLVFSDGVSTKLRGNADSNSIWYDFTDRENTYALLALLATNSSVNLINSNAAPLDKFSLSGSSRALEMWMDCTGGF